LFVPGSQQTITSLAKIHKKPINTLVIFYEIILYVKEKALISVNWGLTMITIYNNLKRSQN